MGASAAYESRAHAVPARAETYGRTESIVGSWLRGRPRDSVVLATKVAGPGRNMAWIRGGPLSLDRSNIREAVEASLTRLGTDYIDLYQLHWPARNQPMFGQWRFEPGHEGPATPIEEQLVALAELVAEGKIRYVGLSNEHPWGLMSFLRAADELGLPRVVSVQNAFNLLNRVFEQSLAEVCFRENVGLLPYSVLGFGLLSGFVGGRIDAFIMRVCDVMLSFPPILIALLIDGVGRALFPNAHDTLAFAVLILAIALSGWVKFARTVRGSTLVERNKEYVQAARVIGVPKWRIMSRHVLPNVMGPVLVLATIDIGQAILIEATLSFLGVGVPPTQPSLGTLIRVGNDFLFSGEWWITIFPGMVLVMIALSVNLLGDWLRDALNPRLR